MSRPATFRLDIQGLRAVAVLLVVLYHANLPLLNGGYIGVDIFFVISGFLITSHIFSGLRNGSFRFRSFYAKRVRRILPASLVVLVATLVVAWLVVPPLALARVGRDAAWTALYMPNILFAREGLDYLASPQPSLFQHYWSLGIEEQFYLLWPLLLWAVYRLTRKNLRVVVWVVAVLAVASFAASVWYTPVNQPWSFFLLPTRAWELAVGGLIAVSPVFTQLRLADRTRNVIASFALGVIVLGAILMNGSLLYPSYWAAIPVIATATIIAVRAPGGPAIALLQNRVMVWIGLISYSIYLVHWPMLVLPEAARSWAQPLELWQTLLLGALSVPLGWLLFRFVETPLRKPRNPAKSTSWRPITAALVCGVLVAAVAITGMRSIAPAQLNTGAEAPAFAVTQFPEAAPFVGTNLSVRLQDYLTESAIPSGRGCNLTTVSSDPPPACSYGDNADAPTVALVGDSHAAQWAPAFEQLAADGDILLTAHTRSGCPIYDRPALSASPDTADCSTWKTAVRNILVDDAPDIIVIGASLSSAGSALETYITGMREVLDELSPSSTVVLLRDTPRFPGDPMSCLSAHLDDPSACSVTRDEGFAAGYAEADAQFAEEFGAQVLDLSDYLCADTCPLVQGNVLVFKDSHHLSKTFTAAMAPTIREQFASWNLITS